MAELKCPRCLQLITPDDTIQFAEDGLAQADCQQPRDLSPEERALLISYCFNHAVATCTKCGKDFGHSVEHRAEMLKRPSPASYQWGTKAAGSLSIRSTLAEAAVSTLERIDTVKPKRRGASEYSVVLCSHHLPSHRVPGLRRTVLGSLHDLQFARALDRALTDPARSALHRWS